MSGQREWRSRAACRSADPELFFPAVEEGPVCAAQVAEARSVCAGCPVRAECLEWARNALPYGIAGGLTAEERRSVGGDQERRRRTRQLPYRPVGGSRREVAAAGREAIRAGLGVAAVAAEFGVTERTASRWAAQVRAEAQAAGQTASGRRFAC